MTQEALKLAFEALNDMACWQEGREVDMGFDEPYAADTSRKAITAIKEALAQKQEQDGDCKKCVDGCPACDARKLPAQRTWVGLTDEEIKSFDAWHDNREEEIGWCNPSEIVAYIEAKLKEKNT